MYSILPHTTPKENIYELRKRQIENVETISKSILASTGYSLFKYSNLKVEDPTAPTYYKVLSAEQVNKVEEGSPKKATIKVPVYDDSYYTIAGNRYIPVFQISDIPIFNKSSNTVIVHNTYSTLVFDSNITEFRIGNESWPFILLLLKYDLLPEHSYHFTVNDFDSKIHLKLCNEFYINFNEEVLGDILTPLTDLDRINYFENLAKDYSDLNKVLEDCLSLWNKSTKINKILSVISIKDHIMVPNGIFNEPYSGLDLIKYLFENREQYKHLQLREINDISQRRARLSEWICYKLAQQSKINKKKKSSNIFTDALISVLTLDQRRILDDSVNPLGELCMMSRIIYNGPGGIAKESCSALVRNLHESYRGIIDPIDSPAGQAIGICQHLVPDCGIENGILTPSKSGSILSTASQLIPLLNHDDGIRVEMACNQQRQAINIVEPEIPLVKTGNEALYTEYTSSLKLAKNDGQVIYKDDNVLVVKYDDSETGDVVNLSNRCFTDFDKTLLTNLNVGDKFTKGSTLAHTNNINPYTHELMLGKNLLIGYMSLDGWNFEDAIVISESCAKKMRYICTHIEKLYLKGRVLFSLKDKEYLPVLPNGTPVKEGDVIFRLGRIDLDSLDTLTPDITEILAPSDGIFKYKTFVKSHTSDHFQMSKWLKEELSKRQTIENKLRDTLDYLDNGDEYKERYCYLDKVKKIDDDCCVIEWSIESERDLHVGCKISNRHGNKGTISIIMPDEKMPTLSDGRHLDVVLNPLGIITRMNAGQLYELHMTWFMDQWISQHRTDSDEDFKKAIMQFVEIIDCTDGKEYSNQISELLNFRDVIDDIKEYGLQIVQEPFKNINEEQLEKLRLLVGVDYETPVMYNGHTYPCSVGWQYMLHLHHEPDHKIFGRSLGAYGKHNQPTSGADSHRLGEMENWALQAYEAFDTQKEFMSIKSDNPVERRRLFQYLYDGVEELYKPITLNTVTNDTFKTYMFGGGIKVEF